MSDTYKTIILPEAQQDIRNIVLYIARELFAPQAAINLNESFREAIISLRQNPKRVPTVPEQPWKNAGIRRTRVKNYYIYFMVDDIELSVKVNAVIYVRMDQTKQMTYRQMTRLCESESSDGTEYSNTEHSEFSDEKKPSDSSNQDRILKSVQELKAGKGTAHELIEDPD